MGNQESLPNDRFIVRKKINEKIVKENNNEKIIKKNNNNNNEINHNFNVESSVFTGKNTLLKKSNSDKKQNNSSFPHYEENYMKKNTKMNRSFSGDSSLFSGVSTKENTNYQPIIDEHYEKSNLNKNQNIQHMQNMQNIQNIQNKLVEKQYTNNAIMERNVLSDLYNSQKQQTRVFDYPSNSNNELDIPKKNFDNIEFTPFNFNDEVNKYKKSLNDEREDFDKIEKVRRSKFEKVESEKKNYLESQIKNFELKYNPWEILGLKYKDYDINNIKKAYKKNALKYHPDRAGNKYEDKFQLITQSYIYLLDKAEQYNQTEIKINKKVENIDYEDNINEKAENIYVSKDKFDLNQFNKIFEDYKVPSTFDKGYSDLMKQDIKTNKNNDNNQVFGKSFNKDVFNAHFEKLKINNKNNTDMIQYKEPDALDTSLGNLNQSFLGVDEMDDFGAVNSNALSYTDYKKAHVDETMLIDVNKVKYKTYKSIDQLESDRSQLSYTQSPEDRQRQEYMERKRMEDDNIRIQKQRDYDEMVQQNYNKINRKLIVNK